MGQKVHPNGIRRVLSNHGTLRFANTKEFADNRTAILKYVSS